LILSYGHSADLQRLLDPAQGWIPKVGVQGVLMSATMTNDVESLKGWALRSPVSSRDFGSPTLQDRHLIFVFAGYSHVNRADFVIAIDAILHDDIRIGQIPLTLRPAETQIGEGQGPDLRQ
jgi:hypothetical protein